MTHDAWVEVRTGALKHNLREVRRCLAPNVRLFAVVKGNAYGHGLVRASEAFVAAGADALAVAHLHEAIELRDAGIGAPILVMTPILPENADIGVGTRAEFAVDSPELILALAEAARHHGVRAKVHLKLDTGMGRLGYPAGTGKAPWREPGFLPPDLEWSGVFSHFARATEKDLSKSERQLRAFLQATDGLRVSRHIANSAGALRLPHSQLDAVRIGTLLYGQRPCEGLPKTLDLRPAWSLKARVIALRELPAGTEVGYGGETVLRRPTRMAVLAIGTSDGFTVAPEGPFWRQSILRFWAKKRKRRLSVRIRGGEAPVLGRVSMNLTSVDVTDLPGVEIGDVAEVPCLRLAASASLPRVFLDA